LTPIDDCQNNEIGRARIFEKDNMDSELFTRNKTHFAQADGTPFTRPPLFTDLHYDGCSSQAQAILDGTITPYDDQYTTILLSELRRCRPPLSPNIDFQEMCYNFKRWKENTSTSPSNKHLGIYKALVNAVHFQITPEDSNGASSAQQALEIQHMILNLAIRECHTLRPSVNRKAPGHPYIRG
jgi:hypothetical protein